MHSESANNKCNIILNEEMGKIVNGSNPKIRY